jgi:hypothetical protein
MSRELPTRRSIRRRGWLSLAIVAAAAGTLTAGAYVGGIWGVALGGVAGALAVHGLSGLLLAGLHSYVLATYRRPWS